MSWGKYMLELPISLFIQQAWNELPDSIAIWSYYHGASYWTIVSKLCSINHIQTSFAEVLAIGSYSKVLLFLFLHFPAGNLHRASIFSSDCIPHRHVPDILWTPPFLDDVQTPAKDEQRAKLGVNYPTPNRWAESFTTHSLLPKHSSYAITSVTLKTM